MQPLSAQCSLGLTLRRGLGDGITVASSLSFLGGCGRSDELGGEKTRSLIPKLIFEPALGSYALGSPETFLFYK